jgi:glycosyltransferase involved in cell wall biosynthesis
MSHGQPGSPEQRALRVAFFAMFPLDHVATRTFCLWPVDHGEQLGISGRLCPPSGPRLHARMNAEGLRLRSLRMAVYWYLLVLPRRLWQIARARGDDVVMVQRGLLHPKSLPLLERLLARIAPRVVYHLDDALWELRPDSYRTRVRLAARVITGTAAGAAYARAAGTPVSIVEYPVDASRYPLREHAERRPSRIGWIGGRPEAYLPPVLPGVVEACRRTGARLRIVSGRRPPSLGPIDAFVEWVRWTPDGERAALSELDLGILPLEDSELHRAKEPFKLKEYMACGLPVVASPVGHVPTVIEEGREGLFARTPEEWAGQLITLIEDPELRARLGARGRALVVERYGVERQLGELADVLRSVARAST